MKKQLSTPLLNRVREALQSAESPEFYWDQHQCLSAEQINKLLVLPDGLRQIEQEILDENEEYIDRLTDELVREILGKYREEIARQLDLSEEDITHEVLDLINHEYDLFTNTPGIDSNIDQLIRRSRPRAVLQLRLYHDHEGWKWRDTVQYKDVRAALRLFNVNPRKMRPKFPDLSYRNGHEYILPKDLLELWDNAAYGGRYVMPIYLNLVEYQKNRDYYNTGIVLRKGSQIWMHHYGNGSGSISVPLQKDLTIRRKNSPIISATTTTQPATGLTPFMAFVSLPGTIPYHLSIQTTPFLMHCPPLKRNSNTLCMGRYTPPGNPVCVSGLLPIKAWNTEGSLRRREIS